MAPLLVEFCMALRFESAGRRHVVVHIVTIKACTLLVNLQWPYKEQRDCSRQSCRPSADHRLYPDIYFIEFVLYNPAQGAFQAAHSALHVNSSAVHPAQLSIRAAALR